jgi:hypothetical protein
MKMAALCSKVSMGCQCAHLHHTEARLKPAPSAVGKTMGPRIKRSQRGIRARRCTDNTWLIDTQKPIVRLFVAFLS